MRMVALKPFRHFRPGEEFEVRTSGEERALKALGMAMDAPMPEPDRRGPGRPRKAEPQEIAVPPPVQSDDSALAAASAPAPRVPRFYSRRDMKAEEE